MRRDKAVQMIKALKREYPNARISLKVLTTMDLLVSTILSAQCTDKRVNIVTRKLFKRYRTVADYANAQEKVLQELIRSVGFFRHKSKNIIQTAKIIKNKFKGKIPDNMKDLTSLPGIARKTANIIIYNAFLKNEGIAVDTHVRRIALRIGLTQSHHPMRIERDLMMLLPRRDWGQFNHLMVEHGRRVCIARVPLCAKCSLNKYCNHFQNKGV